MLKQVFITILLIPPVAILLFFIYSFVVSPPDAGEDISAQLELPFPALMAHRGASGLAPEETEPAYLLARELGADYLEADVQRTKDGVLIALHDDTLERTTNISEVFPDRAKDTVETFTYAELMQLDAGSWFNDAKPDFARESFKGVKILTITELIDIAEGGGHKPGLYLETKAASRFPGIEKELVQLLRNRGWIGTPVTDVKPGEGMVSVAATKGRLVFQSFERDSLVTLKELAPDVPRVYLVHAMMIDESGGWNPLIEDAATIAQGLGPSGYEAWPWYTGPAHRKGLAVHHYTLNKKWMMWLVRQFGSDGIFTDRIDLALEYFNRADNINTDKVFEEIGY